MWRGPVPWLSVCLWGSSGGSLYLWDDFLLHVVSESVKTLGESWRFVPQCLPFTCMIQLVRNCCVLRYLYYVCVRLQENGEAKECSLDQGTLKLRVL